MNDDSLQKIKMPKSSDAFIQPSGKEYFRILSFYSHKWIYILCIIFNIIGGIIPYFIMINLGKIFDTFITSTDFLSQITNKLVIMAILASVMIVILNSSYILRGFSDTLFVQDLRDSLFQNLMTLDASFYDSMSTGILMNRLSEDVTLLLTEYVDKFMNFVQNVSQVVGGIVIGFIVNWRVSLTGIPIVPITLFALIICGRIVRKEIFKCQFQSFSLLGKTEEVLSNFRTVKAFDNEIKEMKDYSNGLYMINSNAKKIARINALKNAILMFFTFVMAMPIFYYGSFLILEKKRNDLSPGDVIVLFTIFGMLGLPIQLTVMSIENFSKASISAAKILFLLDKRSETNQKEGEKLKEVKGTIEFINVSFKYPSRAEYALKNVSFKINQGETVAFVGESGSGKSTIVCLIQRLYEIDEGQILVDGKDIKEYSPESLRETIAVVSQEPSLFTMSVADNICFCMKYPNAEITNEKIVEAAQLGNAHNFVMELPNSYETIINPINLSGGQKQRICISRAILANTPILIFDEATSSLDSESEQLVQESIERIKKGKTCILIAHRLSTIMNADQIFVLRNGSIIEKGTHKELIDQKAYYFDLFKYQQY